jgi:hypothetical protein
VAEELTWRRCNGLAAQFNLDDEFWADKPPHVEQKEVAARKAEEAKQSTQEKLAGAQVRQWINGGEVLTAEERSFREIGRLTNSGSRLG